MIKQIFLGLVIATLARAEAQEAASLSQLPQASLAVPASQHSAAPRPARANFQGESASSDTRRMADWVVASADHGSMPFVIVDKKDAKVFVFDHQGQILGAAPALLGLAVGDDSAPGVGDKPLSAIAPKDRTTPAGRFIGYLGHDPGKPNFLWVDFKNNISLHRVVHGNPKDHRFERLATPTPLDNRISFGCINVPVDFFERTVLPTFKGAKGVVYILPEIKPTRAFFPKYYDVND
ncbi:MAG TPA: hypothetical protein VFI23_10815 [Rhizomicrobium sp.]|nr:hypothetical protein [Rhizomicrobium sp.]